MKLADLVSIFQGHNTVLFKLTGFGEAEYDTVDFADAFCEIEALQQENERLQAQIDEWKYETQCHMDIVMEKCKEVVQLQNDNINSEMNLSIMTNLQEQLQKQNEAMREALKQARETLITLNTLGGLGFDKHRWIDEALATIDKAVGK